MMTQSVQTEDFLCFAKRTKFTDKGYTSAIANTGSKPIFPLGPCTGVGVTKSKFSGVGVEAGIE